MVTVHLLAFCLSSEIGNFRHGQSGLLGSRTLEQVKAIQEASSKLGRVCLTTIPFQPSLCRTEFEAASALRLDTLAGEREDHCTRCGEAKYFVHPYVCVPRIPWRVTRHEGAKRITDRPLPSPPAPELGLSPSDTRPAATMTPITLLGSQVKGLAIAEYNLTVVSLASKNARTTSLPEQDINPPRPVGPVNKYLD